MLAVRADLAAELLRAVLRGLEVSTEGVLVAGLSAADTLLGGETHLLADRYTPGVPIIRPVSDTAALIDTIDVEVLGDEFVVELGYVGGVVLTVAIQGDDKLSRGCLEAGIECRVTGPAATRVVYVRRNFRYANFGTRATVLQRQRIQS